MCPQLFRLNEVDQSPRIRRAERRVLGLNAVFRLRNWTQDPVR